MSASPNMPDFGSATHAFHHTVDSALAALADLDVSPARITLRMDGLGYPTRWIVSQSPSAGTPLTAGVTVSLVVAGTGIFNALPVGMWDKGGGAEPGTQEMVEVFDDPFQKLAHWLREGARLFDVRPDNPVACSRWMSLFGVNPDAWPPEMWYNLSILLPNIQALAGKEYGLRFALRLLLDLPLLEIRSSPNRRYLADTDISLLGDSFGRLGVDFVVGDHIEDLAKLTLVVGHVPLSTYYAYQQVGKRQLLESTLDLLMPVYQRYVVRWTVLDQREKPRLGDEAHNGLLGVNSYLGPAPEVANSGRSRGAALMRQ